MILKWNIILKFTRSKNFIRIKIYWMLWFDIKCIFYKIDNHYINFIQWKVLVFKSNGTIFWKCTCFPEGSKFSNMLRATEGIFSSDFEVKIQNFPIIIYKSLCCFFEIYCFTRKIISFGFGILQTTGNFLQTFQVWDWN